jgi:hypothetical protein
MIHQWADNSADFLMVVLGAAVGILLVCGLISIGIIAVGEAYYWVKRKHGKSLS